MLRISITYFSEQNIKVSILLDKFHMPTSGCLLVVLLVHNSFGLTRVFERALVVTVVVSGDLGYPVPVGGPQKVNVGQCATEH